jgi:hypothetical protein
MDRLSKIEHDLERLSAMDGHINQVYVDIDIPLIAKSTGVGTPNYTTLLGNIVMLQWAVNDALSCDSEELIHGWVEGGDGNVHCHVVTGGTDAADRYLKFTFEYTWANVSATFPATATLTSAELLIPAGTAAYTHLLFSLGTITFTGGKIGGHVKGRFKRIASAGTAPTANPFCEMVQMHVLVNALGSRQITTK